MKIGIRRENKNKWEKRVPLTPNDMKILIDKYNLQFILQPSPIRIFTDEEYISIGAEINENLSECSPIFAVKEIPLSFFEKDKTYIFFSHTIKGQAYNIPMLKRMMELKDNLIDYEKVVDKHGKRLIFFGTYAGYAGMIDSFYALGRKLDWLGITNHFDEINMAHSYKSLEQAKQAIRKIGQEIARHGLPKEITPFICGFAGYGHVSTGAQKIFDLLPYEEISPKELLTRELVSYSNKKLYKVIFKEEHIARPKNDNDKFELQDYYHHPEKYISNFEQFIPYLSMLINGIYWDEPYPKLITKDYVKNNKLKLLVIGDISCDIEGAIELTVKATEPDNPIYVYNSSTGEISDGVEGDGIVIMAVDNLPCEISKEASIYFSKQLMKFVPAIAKADFSSSIEKCHLPDEIRRALILYHGKLTDKFKYMEKFLHL